MKLFKMNFENYEWLLVYNEAECYPFIKELDKKGLITLNMIKRLSALITRKSENDDTEIWLYKIM